MALPRYHSADLDALYDAGAHFVLAKSSANPDLDKRAVERSWQRASPPLEKMKKWDELLGIVPTSLDLVVVDCDTVPPETVTALLGEPLASSPAPSPAGPTCTTESRRVWSATASGPTPTR